MKRLTLTIAFAITMLFAKAQTKETTTLYKGNAINFKIVQFVENQTDTTTIWYYGYQNKKYSAITDIGSIAFGNKKDLMLFAGALLKVADKPSKTAISINIAEFYIKRYDFSDNIYIIDDEDKYTSITKDQAYKTVIEITKVLKYLKD